MMMPDVPDTGALPRAPLADAIDRARESVGSVALQLDNGLLRGAPADAAGMLRSVQQLLATLGDEARPAAEAAAGRALVFDVSDMFGYFPDNRLPTGVQRVQISIILSILDAPGDWAVSLTRFVEGRDEWAEVPIAPFRQVCRLSMADGDAFAPDWRGVVAKLEATIASQPAMAFPINACLVNLGSSWWLPNYFMFIRQAKADFGIRYVPLIHDMIPALMPKDCHPDLVHEFIDWLMGVVRHADSFLANSDATKADLLKFAAILGYAIPDEAVAVVPLQAELSHVRQAPRDQAALLARWRLSPGSFVLLVSTLEVRKNQIGAFEAWQQLIGVHGKGQVPQLVCVGKRGYRNDMVFARRSASADLEDKVLILERVDDAELEALYGNCLFTVYPSFYEGWGLPVTESLAHGKVPLTADNSSLPQAGGGLSVMFETGSQTAFVAALERLIYDPAYRAAQEAAIARGFVPRRWADVARDMEAPLRRLGDGAGAPPAPWTPPLAAPGFYPLVRNREMRVSAGMGSAEVFRAGGGWWRLEDFGCWTRAAGGALRMRLPAGPGRIGFELAGLPTLPTSYAISVAGQAAATEGTIARDARKWVFFDVPALPEDGDVTLHLIGHRTEIVVASDGTSREIGVGLRSFFVFDPHNPNARLDFVEAVALGALDSYNATAPSGP